MHDTTSAFGHPAFTGALPPLAAVLASTHVVRLPLRVKFRGVTEREALLFEGPQGWGEFSPFTEYGDAEAAVWLSAGLDFAWNEQPQPRRNSIPVNATVPAVEANRVAGIVARFGGARTAKVKVAEPGQTLEDDVARVAATRAALGDDAKLRVDANGGWSLEEALVALTALAPYGLEYAEQPCGTVKELRALRDELAARGIAVPIAADESVRKASDPLKVARARAADLIVVKAQPLGGVSNALKISQQTGLPTVVSSALDTSVGLAQGAWLAACLPELDHACGLGTAALLAADVTRDPLMPRAGSIPVRRVRPDLALLAQHAADAERRDWWISRLTRCYQQLDEAQH